MLTEAEKKWLYSRENVEMVTGTYICQFCQYMDDELEECIFRRCPKFEPDFRDAAEFEARVSRIMALYLGAPPCGVGTCNNPNFLCPECRLKHARLKAEQEME